MSSLINVDQINTFQEAYQAIHKIQEALTHIWVKDSLFTWQWWTGVGLTIVPWVMWFFLRIKDSTDRLLYAGLSIILIASWLDFAGIALGLWSYEYEVLPFIPSFIPWDFSLMPVVMMLLLQYKPEIHPFIKAVFFGAMTAFIGGPLFKWMGMYVQNNWEYIYSFGIYIVLYLMVDFISKRNNFKRLTNSS